jgi:hypothetical protein
MILRESLRIVSHRAVLAAEGKIETTHNSGQSRNESVARSPTANATALSAINLFID